MRQLIQIMNLLCVGENLEMQVVEITCQAKISLQEWLLHCVLLDYSLTLFHSSVPCCSSACQLLSVTHKHASAAAARKRNINNVFCFPLF